MQRVPAASGKIVFCFPYHGTGGVSLLFLNIAEALAMRGIDTAIVDYADGFMAAHRTQTRLQLIEYRDDVQVRLPEDATVVFQSITPWSIYPSLNIAGSAKILFWNLHPFNLVPTLPGARRTMQLHLQFGRAVLATLLRGYRNKMRRLVRLMQHTQSLVFMDIPNLQTTENYLGIKIDNPRMLAVGIPSAGRPAATQQRDFNSSGLRLAWIGRIVDFKYFILARTLEELNRIQPRLAVPVTFTIVGSGELQSSLKSVVSGLQHLDVRFIDHLPPTAIADFLRDEVDVLCAMGTSALEGARIGVPTILLDMSYGTVPRGYRFRWLFEEDGFTMARIIDRRTDQAHNDSLQQRMAEAMQDHAALSRRTLAYFEEHHCVEGIASDLLRIARDASCTFWQLEREGLLGRGVGYASFAALRKIALR